LSQLLKHADPPAGDTADIAQASAALSTLTFHLALAAMKLGVILEGVHPRCLGGKHEGRSGNTLRLELAKP
jgi:hypothetical protein